MRPWLFGILASLSLLLFVAVAGMWVRSYRVADTVGYGARHSLADGAIRLRFAAVRSSRGGVSVGSGSSLELFVRASSMREGLYARHDAPPPAESQGQWARWGFGHTHVDLGNQAFVTRSVRVPYWFLTLLAAGACALLGWRRYRTRYGAGRCRTCGYDLRETKERCPECGTGVPREAGA